MAARRGKNQARRNNNNGTPGWVWLVVIATVLIVAFLAAPNLFKKNGNDFLRAGPQPNPNAQPAPVTDADIDAVAQTPQARTPASATEPSTGKPADAGYVFYTLLPGKEVQMSDAELAASARAESQRQAEAQRAQAALEGRAVPPAAAPTPINETPRQPQTSAQTVNAAPARSEQVATAAPAAATTGNGHYVLQVGAFGASGDAEAVKAKLAMMGLSARVEPAQINGTTVYRVRMGPYASVSELARAKATLEGSGVQAMAVKMQ